MSQLSIFSGPSPRQRQQPSEGGEQTGSADYPPGWGPWDLPEPAATVVRLLPAFARIAALTTVHRLHDASGTKVTRGRNAGLAYLAQREMAVRGQAAREKMTPADEPDNGVTGGDDGVKE